MLIYNAQLSSSHFKFPMRGLSVFSVTPRAIVRQPYDGGFVLRIVIPDSDLINNFEDHASVHSLARET